MPLSLGELLLQANMITPQQLQEALHHQKLHGGRLSGAFLALGFVDAQDVTRLLSRHYRIPSIDLTQIEIDPFVLRIISPDQARKHQVLPLSRSGATLTVAVSDPADLLAMDDLRHITGYHVDPTLTSETALKAAIETYYSSPSPQAPPRDSGAGPDARDGAGLTPDDLASVGLSEVDVESLADVGTGTDPETVRSDELEIDLDSPDLGSPSRPSTAPPVVKLVNVLLVDAFKRRASAIHVEPYRTEFRVRFRIDGVLYNVMALPPKLREPLTSRIKTMARLDSPPRVPTDGRIRVVIRAEGRSRRLEFRVSCLPTLWGEKVVLHLAETGVEPDLTTLGLEGESLEKLERVLAGRRGMVLVTGPRRCGKSRTLYSILAALGSRGLSIVTAEDPVEFGLPGANQLRIRPEIGLTVPAALRSVMRHDADVVLVGETRAGETARAALDAALGGLLVLTGMSERDGPGALAALRAMGVPPSRLGRGLKLLMTQRLVRRVCPDCKEVRTDDAAALSGLRELMGAGADTEPVFHSYRGRGCPSCYQTGYKGQIGLFEVMPISGRLREMLAKSEPATAIRERALEESTVTLRMSGLEKIRQGITTVEEVLWAT